MKSGYRFRRKTTGKPIKVKAGLRNSRKRVMGKQETEEVTENTPEMYGRKKKNIKIKSINEFKKESSYKSTDVLLPTFTIFREEGELAGNRMKRDTATNPLRPLDLRTGARTRRRSSSRTLTTPLAIARGSGN